MKSIDLAPLNKHIKRFLELKTPNPKVVLVRNAESQGNLAGTITGWMDVKLSDFGRKQAFHLSSTYEEYATKFSKVHCSDLNRSIDTSYYAMAFPGDEEYVLKSRLLRELNFGVHEGLHFDNLSPAEKERFSHPDFQAQDGENWTDVRKRAEEYFSAFERDEAHLVFTHGGLIASYLYNLGVTEMPPNCSLVGVLLEENGSGKASDLLFEWDFPYLEEDI